MRRGTNFARISHALTRYECYRLYRHGDVPLAAYIECLETHQQEWIALGFTEDDLYLTTRTPLDDHAFVDISLAYLRDTAIIGHVAYDERSFSTLRDRVRAIFKHDQHQTYIFPEEERLLYAIADVVRPKQIAVLGCYYGYWSVWLTDIVRQTGAHMVLIDTDPHVLALAGRNMAVFCAPSSYTLINDDAVKFMEYTSASFDFFLLDAEGRPDEESPEYRGKRIYYPIFAACCARATPRAILVAHNVMLDKCGNSPYFVNKKKKNLGELAAFVQLVEHQWGRLIEVRTTEGVGVAARKQHEDI